jgi:hypothetical protein
MMRAANPVGSRFASLPLALVHPRKLTPRGLRRRVTSHCLSNRNKVRIEFAVTHSKQKTAIISNRNSFRGRLSNAEKILGADQAKFEVRRLAAAFIGRDLCVPDGFAGRALARPSSRAVGALPGKPGRYKAAASRRTPHKAKKRLIATLANSKISLSQSQQKTSHFLTATRNTLCRFQILYPESAAARRPKGRAAPRRLCGKSAFEALC